MQAIAKFFKDEEGAAAVEYGLLVALIAAVIITVVTTLGSQVKAAFCTVVNALATSTNVAATGCVAATPSTGG